MRRTTLITATLIVALAGPAVPAVADGPVLPPDAHGTVVTVAPAKILPGSALRVNVRCMTHVGGAAVMTVASPAFPTVTATRQNMTFSRPTDPKMKPGTYSIRAACKAPGAFVKKNPAADVATFTVAAPPAPPQRRMGPPQRRMGPAVQPQKAPQRRAMPGIGRTTQTSRVPVGGAATGFAPLHVR